MQMRSSSKDPVLDISCSGDVADHGANGTFRLFVSTAVT